MSRGVVLAIEFRLIQIPIDMLRHSVPLKFIERLLRLDTRRLDEFPNGGCPTRCRPRTPPAHCRRGDSQLLELCPDLWIVKRLSNRRRQFLANGERRSGWRAQAPPVRYVQAGHARLRRRRRIGIARQARGPGSRQYMNPWPRWPPAPARPIRWRNRPAPRWQARRAPTPHCPCMARAPSARRPAREQQPRQVGRRAHSRRGIEERARPFLASAMKACTS